MKGFSDTAGTWFSTSIPARPGTHDGAAGIPQMTCLASVHNQAVAFADHDVRLG
jgi:hypothetical protein